MIFQEYKNLDLSKISKEVLSYWERNDIFKKSIEKMNTGINLLISFLSQI